MLPGSIPENNTNRVTQDPIIDHMPGVWNSKSALAAAHGRRTDSGLRLNQGKGAFDPLTHQFCCGRVLLSDAR